MITPIEERCPLCGAAGVVDDGHGVYRAHCGDCYEGDPEAEQWRHLQGMAFSATAATDLWLDRAREHAANDTIPPLPISYTPVGTLSALAFQVAQESERQRGWVHYKRAGGPAIYGPVASLALVGEVS